MSPLKKQLFDLEVKGQGPTTVIMVRDTALWSCTHIPNIIDLSGNTKKVMVRTNFAGKKRKKINQTKKICLPSFEGET